MYEALQSPYFKSNKGFANNRLSNNRYADFDQIKYSLRSIEMYAPWANHIYIVTNGQVPDWLNTGKELIG